MRQRTVLSRPHRGRNSFETKPPFRKKLLFESLEQRLLLSADPLGSVTAAGVLRSELGNDADTVVVRQVGAAADGGVIIDLTAGSITERYGNEEVGLTGIELHGAGGDDSFELIGLTVGA